MSILIQLCIGFIFVTYSIYSLLRNRRAQTKENVIVCLVCIFTGIFLLGYAVFQIITVSSVLTRSYSGKHPCLFP